MFLRTFLALGLLFSTLRASLEDHFKKVEGKGSYHRIRNIDFIYVINLDERPEKFQHCQNELYPFGIIPYRFSAVNGWKLSLETINAVGIIFEPQMKSGLQATCYPVDKEFEPHEIIHQIGKTYFGHGMSKGAIGIVLSHLSILQDAYDSGYETIWIMEDDIQVIRSPHILSDLIAELDTLTSKEWDVLFTDRDTKNQQGDYIPCSAYAPRPNFFPLDPTIFQLKQSVNHNFRRVGARYGAYSMIVRRSGMKKILDFLKEYKIFLPYDMEFTFPPGIRLFTVEQDVVSTLPKALSDNGSPGYTVSN
jgi:GR25 family glycosyltransferase involved in LPS biosynthesis